VSGVHRAVFVDELAAFPIEAQPGSWTVWRGADQVGVLEVRRTGGTVWLAGRVDEDLVAEGPTALAVLRRLARRSQAQNVGSFPASPLWT